MRLLTTVGLTLILSPTLAQAKGGNVFLPIDPTQLMCVLKSKQFITEITFKKEADGSLSGEMDNFVETNLGTRKFISGSIFFDITPHDNYISGHTGDPRGIVSNFVLRPSGTPPQKKWIYEQMDPSGEKNHAAFRCSEKRSAL